MGSKLQFLKKSLKCDYALENNIETLYRHLGKLMEKIHIYIYTVALIKIRDYLKMDKLHKNLNI